MIASEVRDGGLRFGSKTLVGHVSRDLALADNHLRLADWIVPKVRKRRDVGSSHYTYLRFWRSRSFKTYGQNNILTITDYDPNAFQGLGVKVYIVSHIKVLAVSYSP